jgi:hypothetical protein
VAGAGSGVKAPWFPINQRIWLISSSARFWNLVAGCTPVTLRYAHIYYDNNETYGGDEAW